MARDPRMNRRLTALFAAAEALLVLGVGLGLLAAMRHRSWLDQTIRVLSLVGISTALDWCYSGRLVSAVEARQAGLVRSVHAAGDL